jgi:SAM-dependent methyltransferase
MNTLYRQGILSNLQSAGDRNVILEIGAGYGGFAHHLSKLLVNSTYVIVDLPETLMFAAVYITQLNPNKRVFVYDPNDFKAEKGIPNPSEYDFMLFPNFRLDDLRQVRFDFVINIASLQEMRTDQAAKYLDFVVATLKGTFYSYNHDAQPRNSEMGCLSDLICSRFEAKEILREHTNCTSGRARLRDFLVKILKHIAVFLKLLDCAPRTVEHLQGGYREYVCTPKQQE